MNRLNRLLDRMFTTDQMEWPKLRSMFLTLVLDQFFIFFIGMLSTALVSSVGEAAIAAVSMVGTVNGMVSLVFSSLASGGALVVARAKGRNDPDGIRRTIGEVTGLCGTVATVLSVLLYVFAGSIVNLLYPSVEPLLTEYAVRYMRMMAISFIPFSVFNAIFCIFRNLGDTRSSLFLTIAINVTHLLLSLLFINGLGMGVSGSGLAYILARLLGMGLALLWILRFANHYGVVWKDFFHFRRSTTREILSLGMPMTVESLLMQGGMLLVQVYLAGLTTTDLAAHAVANSILNLYNTTAGALVTISGTVCGQCFGAGRQDLVRKYCYGLIRAGRFVLLATVLLLYPLTPLLLQLYNATSEGAAIIYRALRIAAVAMPLLYCDAYIPAIVLRVVGDSMFVSTVSVLGLAMGRCLLGYLLTVPAGLGVIGIWIGMAVEWFLRALALRIRSKGRLMEKAAPG